jgi:hypothetical protein
MVEIDEVGLKENAGNVHQECLRPADRILGRTIFPNLATGNLVNFDYEKWGDLLKKGQGFLQNAKMAAANKIPILSWNKKHNFNKGNYCIIMIMEDGSSRYVRLGKELHRFIESEIDSEVSNFNDSLREAIDSGDPMGSTSESKMFGPISQLISRAKSDSDKILKVIRYEKAKYSQQIEIVNNQIENDYTPLGLVVDLTSGLFINFGNCIPIISNPLQFEKLHKNWHQAGYKIGKCTLKIIENDKELDLYLMAFFSDRMQPIIDPYFDEEKELEKGIYISDFEDLKEEKNKQSGIVNPDGVWKAGDRVKVVFPDVVTDKFARGIVLIDEFIDETNESCILFRPIEDGVVRDDLQFKMPSRLLVKD